MLILGYIISDIKYNDLKEDVIQVVKSESECELPLPKLIIGLDNAKQYAKNHNLEFSILEHSFSNGNMWTFKKTEKREYYEQVIKDFRLYIIKSILNNIDYYYINIYKLKYNKIKDLYNILFNNKLQRKKNIIVIDKDIIYYPLQDNKVIGISFNMLKYINIDKEKVIDKLKKGINNNILYTSSKNMWKFKDWFKNVEYVIPSILQENIKN